MTAHQQLRAAYLASGLTLEEVAHRVGCARSTALRVVGRRPRTVKSDIMFAVAEVLSVQSLSVSTFQPEK